LEDANHAQYNSAVDTKTGTLKQGEKTQF